MSVFAPVPSLASPPKVRASATVPASATVVGIPIGPTGPVPAELGLTRRQLTAAGFDGTVGATLTVPGDKPVRVAVGIGTAPDHVALRDAAGAFGRATPSHTKVAFVLPADGDGAAAVEGIVLSRYRYDTLRTAGARPALTDVAIVGADKAAVAHGAVLAAATAMSRDLANSPHSHLTASKLADLAVELADDCGYTVEVFDKAQLQEMGCGGLLGVNAGSIEPPRMVKMVYTPSGEPTGHLTMVGKGIMYDSGGLSLKPGDEVHAQMKNDMSGAAAVMAAFAHLKAAGCPAKVTGYLMCTDNMPSGTAMAMGDVITIRGGTTVEVINTDAEGRLVMSDALVLAAEEGCDAVIDIATLTGACMRALGTRVGGLFANNEALAAQIASAADSSDEPLWRLPLERRYRHELNSPVADMRNLGGANGGAITAALFLEHFVGGLPWAHIDIAGTAQSFADTLWHTAGCSGFGARMLVQVACDFTAPEA
jgi:leucyl aminopeptidase